ncbi:UbiA family prenyltransferase [Desulfovibrio caledoniensis]
MKLSRIDSCLLTFLAIMAPVAYHSQDILLGVTQALPVFPIAMCGFVVNDINDIEKDVINHPERPLPRREIRVTSAVIFYFALLAISLVLIRLYISGASVFYYVAFCLGMTNYNLVVNHFPRLKNFYVVVVTMLPILIAINSSGLGYGYYLVALSLALFMMGRELLMDVHDAEGDCDNLAIAFGTKRIRGIGFGLQIISFVVLVPLAISSAMKTGILMALIAMSTFFMLLWQKPKWQHPSIMLMKIQMLFGLAFLA